eukprot:CAMPEP_0119536350 /NCGR_PEP_ID=MMETSP1344-20130328/49199_1 /TAXON_ID=236787 /ORGANISM="Florenciella parvula, Strain CCMP2471" /LENGTH=103 /DNA_ID=CAMNT_0007578353 /DNA_START=232 /DNA_END=540 /DNA_ORIENTATION=-
MACYSLHLKLVYFAPLNAAVDAFLILVQSNLELKHINLLLQQVHFVHVLLLEHNLGFRLLDVPWRHVDIERDFVQMIHSAGDGRQQQQLRRIAVLVLLHANRA